MKYSCKPESATFVTSLFILALFGTVLTGTGTAQVQPATSFVGEFEGRLLKNDDESLKAGLIVTELGNDTYQAVLYYGGLPENEDSGEYSDKVELQGTYQDFTLRLKGNSYRFQFIYGRYTALDEDNSYRGHLLRVVRVDPVAGQN